MILRPGLYQRNDQSCIVPPYEMRAGSFIRRISHLETRYPSLVSGTISPASAFATAFGLLVFLIVRTNVYPRRFRIRALLQLMAVIGITQWPSIRRRYNDESSSRRNRPLSISIAFPFTRASTIFIRAFWRSAEGHVGRCPSSARHLLDPNPRDRSARMASSSSNDNWTTSEVPLRGTPWGLKYETT